MFNKEKTDLDGIKDLSKIAHEILHLMLKLQANIQLIEDPEVYGEICCSDAMIATNLSNTTLLALKADKVDVLMGILRDFAYTYQDEHAEIIEHEVDIEGKSIVSIKSAKSKAEVWPEEISE